MKKLLKAALAAVLTLSLVACGGGNGDSKKGGTITVGCEELSGTFSPIYYSSSYDGYVVSLVYDSLYDYDYEGNLAPKLAETFEETDGGKTLTVTLKEGIVFSNGEPLDSSDVEFTFKVLSDPSYTGRYGSYVQYLEGYADYAAVNEDGSPKHAEEPAYPGIEVVDEKTIVFHFTEAKNDNDLDVVTMPILCKEQFTDYKYGYTKPLEDAMGEPIGTGPYVLNKWEAGTGASLSRNEKYWGEGYTGITNVIIKPVEMSTEYQELESGSVDMINAQIEPSKIAPASNNENLAMNVYPRAGMGFIAFNCAKGATADKAVRQALTFAFDRQSFCDAYYACEGCTGLAAEAEIGYVPATFNNPASPLRPIITKETSVDGLEVYNYDIEKAASVLDEAGWTVGTSGKREKDGKVLEIKVLAIQDHDILSNLIPMWQKAWGETLKCDVKIATVDFNTLLEKVYSDAGLDEWNVFFMATSYTANNMSGVYTTFHSDYAKENNDNYSRLVSPAVDAAMEAARAELDEAKELELWTEAMKLINDECPMVPVYGNTYFDIYNAKIKNLKTSTLYDWCDALKDATIE